MRSSQLLVGGLRVVDTDAEDPRGACDTPKSQRQGFVNLMGNNYRRRASVYILDSSTMTAASFSLDW